MRPHRMLWSYHYARKANMDEVWRQFGHRPKVFADSGGYSAFTQGVTISLDEYADWLLAHRERFEVYANLDAIGDARATFKNQEALERKGLRPLPVFHYGSPLSWLDRYADAGHSYIALGGLVGASPEKLMPWLIQCFKWAERRKAQGRPVVFHGFGITSVPVLASLPWYTVDSTSWNSGARYARIGLFNRTTGAWKQMDLFDVKSVMSCAPLLAQYGEAARPFLAREAYHFTDAVRLSARSWRAFEDACRRRWGEQPHPEGLPFEPGLHVYLADGSQNNHVAANAALTPTEPA